MKIKGTWKALSPISHNADTSLSTTTLFRKQKMITAENEVVEVPVITGNSVRGIMRRLIMRDMLNKLGVGKGEIYPDFYYILFSGGFIAKGASGRYNLQGMKQKIRDYIPPLSLLGTAFGAQTMDGRCDIGIAYPLCDEIKHLVSNDVPQKMLKNTFWVYLDEVFYTRRDDLEEENDTVTQMKYEIESLAPGTYFTHEIIDRTETQVEASCLNHMIQLFAKNGIIGGKKATGHGKIDADYNTNQLPEPKIYLDFLEDNKDKIFETFQNIATEAKLSYWRKPDDE